MNLTQALNALNPENAGHWTAEGLPRLDILKGLTDDDATREAIRTIAPQFSRSNPNIEKAQPKAEPVQAETVTKAPKKAKEKTGSIEEAIQEKQTALSNVDAEIAALTHKRLVIEKEVDALILKRDSTPVNFADEIKRFQLSQAKQRAESAAQRRMFADSLMKHN